MLRGLLLAFLALKLIHGAIVLAPTFDEYKHSLSGWAYLETGVCCSGQSDTAMVALNGLPWVLMDAMPLGSPRTGHPFDWGNPEDRYPPVHWRNTLARLPNVALALALAWLVYREVRQLAGETPALLALAFACACPNLTAHGMLVSTDAQGAFGFFLGVAGFSGWLRRGMGRSGFAWAVVTFALAQLSKYTSLLLVPILFTIAALGGGRSLKERAVAVAKTAALFLLGFALVLLVYELPARLMPRNALTPELYALAGHRGYLGGLELPFAMSRYGVPGYFLGEFGTTWKHFYLVCLLVKTPIVLLACGVLGAVALLRGPFPWRDRLLLALPPLVVFASSSLSKVTFALRYILQVFPFLAAVGGLSILLLPARARAPAALALGLLALVEGSLVHPHELAYFNLAAGGPAAGPRYFLDSNLDWGQDLAQLAAELKRRGIDEVYLSYHGSIPPEVYRIHSTPLVPRQPVHGWVAISVTHLYGLFVPRMGEHDPEAFAWLRARTPDAVIGHTIHLYHVP